MTAPLLPLRLAIVAGAIAGLAACSKEAPPASPPRPVVTHVVSLGKLQAEANYSGEIRPRHELAVAFRVGGKLASRRVEVGQEVKPGQILARLDPADVELNASAARASRAAAESDFAFAQAEFDRYRDLRARNFVSQAALEAREAAWRAARGRLEATSAQAGLAQNQNAYATLTADAAGVVSAVLAEAGQVLAAGQPVLRLARSGEMEVAIAVPENRVEDLRRATAIDITLWAQDGKHYRGRLREIAPMADPVTRTYGVRVSLLEPDSQVRLGMTANVHFAAADAGHGARVPATAIFQHESRPAVWVVGPDQTLALRPVDVAAFREDGAVVSAGLKDGERIVAAGVHKVVAGEKVRVAP